MSEANADLAAVFVLRDSFAVSTGQTKQRENESFY
jgi:hypothetical protein